MEYKLLYVSAYCISLYKMSQKDGIQAIICWNMYVIEQRQAICAAEIECKVYFQIDQPPVAAGREGS